MARFNSAWWQIVKADPVTAIDALLAKCFGYFNPMDQPYVSMDYYVNSDYVTDQTTWIKYWCSEWRQSIAEGAKQFGEIPVLGWVAHGNLYVMMTLLIGAAEVVLRRWRTLVMHLPLLLLIYLLCKGFTLFLVNPVFLFQRPFSIPHGNTKQKYKYHGCYHSGNT